MTFHQAARQLIREWRSGEIYVLFFSIVIAVAAVSSVGFFTDRVERALETQANELLGADLLVNGEREFSQDYFQEASRLGLSIVRQLTFPSMVLAARGNHLAWLKVVEPGFPLRGQVGISHRLFASEVKTRAIPAPGTVWVEPRLFTALKLQVGDSVQIGAMAFKVVELISSEPGRGGDLFNIAPRVLMNMADLARTQLIQPGSRVRYTLLLAGKAAALERYRKFVKKRGDVGVSMQGIKDARPEIRVALDRAQKFLGLAALTSVILAGIAIGLAARRFARRHLDHCAIMRCVGATQREILAIFLWQIILLGLIASVAGIVAGYFTHEILINLLGSLVGVALPVPGFMPVLLALVTGMITLAGFALPPIIGLKNVPALRVIKRDLAGTDNNRLLSYVLGVAALCSIMIAQAGDIRLGVYMVGGMLLAIALLIVVAYSLIAMIKHLPGRSAMPWYIGLRNMVRRMGSTVMQIVAFGLGIMALLILTVIRGDLLDEWQASIPEKAPNRFIVNIAPDQVESMRQFFEEHDLAVKDFYPMVRGRIVAINGKVINRGSFEDQHAKQLLSREFNLSWAVGLPKSNTLLKGKWWKVEELEQPLVSLEKSVAQHLQIKTGDELRFKVATQHFVAKVKNIREVDWSTFGANFYVLTPPKLLQGFPMTYMVPFYLPAGKYELLNDLVAKFNNITVIDVAAIMTHVRKIIDRVTLAVEYVFVFTLLAGLMVLFAGIQSTLDERMLETPS